MLIQILLNLVLALLRVLLLPFQVAALPGTVATTFLTFTAYVADGMRVVNAYIDTVYIGSLFVFIMSINVFTNGYRFVMWLLRKIPFLGID